MEEQFNRGLPIDYRCKLMVAASPLTSLSNNANIISMAKRLANTGTQDIISLLLSNATAQANNNRFYLERWSLTNCLPKWINKLFNINNITRYYDIKNNSYTPYILFDTGWATADSYKVKSLKLSFSSKYNKILEKDLLNKFTISSNSDNIIFSAMRSNVSDVVLRDFQYKSAHNIIQTRCKIFKYKYIQDPYCLACIEAGDCIVDDQLHSFFECPNSIVSIKRFETNVKSILDLDICVNADSTFTSSIEFHNKNIRRSMIRVITESYIEIKKRLHSPMSARRTLSDAEINKLIRERAKIHNINLLTA